MDKPAKYSNTPSYRDHNRPSVQEACDDVEEASMESFPASDPSASRRPKPGDNLEHATENDHTALRVHPGT